MNDTNGREIKTGDFITISGAYFKNSNGLFLVEHANDAPGYETGNVWLHKCKKSGELCLDRAGTTLGLPMSYYCSDGKKNRAAREHDRANLRYEITEGVPTWHAAEHFKKTAAEYADRAENQRRLWGENSEDAKKTQNSADFYAAVATRLMQTAEQPKEKEPQTGVRFYWNGIKVDGGRLIPCWYSVYDNEVHISAREYSGDLPGKYFNVKNDSDIYTDYFCKDSTTLTPEHPLYKYARYVALKNLVNGKDWHTPKEEQKAEFARMSDPGQPTAADYAAIEELRLAEKNAREAARRAAELAERERVLKIRSEGRVYIEGVMEQHPLMDGDPRVEIPFSEHPAFYSWTQSRDQTRTEITVSADGTREEKTVIEVPRRRLILSVAAAEIVLKHFDEQKHAEHAGYDKTDFVITYTDPDTGEQNTYEGRYDLGDNDGGLIAHIRAFSKSQFHGEQETAQILALADYLEQFTENGRIVNVTVDKNLIDLALYRKQQEKKKVEQARQEWEEIQAAVAMLTDEQIESAVFSISPKDKEKLDVARFFLQELTRRDAKRALEVFRKWQAGA